MLRAPAGANESASDNWITITPPYILLSFRIKLRSPTNNITECEEFFYWPNLCQSKGILWFFSTDKVGELLQGWWCGCGQTKGAEMGQFGLRPYLVHWTLCHTCFISADADAMCTNVAAISGALNTASHLQCHSSFISAAAGSGLYLCCTATALPCLQM